MLKLSELCIIFIFKHNPNNPTLLYQLCSTLPTSLSDFFFLFLMKHKVLGDTQLKYLTNTLMRDFDCTDCVRVGNEGVKELIENVKNVEGLRLKGTSVTTQVLSIIVQACSSTLRVLELDLLSTQQIRSSGGGLESLCKCTQLTHLDISGISEIVKVKEKALIKVIKSCTKLQVFRMSGCSDTLLPIIAQTLTDLKVASFRGSVKITHAGVAEFLVGCKHLVSLDIFACVKVSLLELLGSEKFRPPLSTSVRHLDFSGVSVEGVSFHRMHELFPNLESLDLHNLAGINGASLPDLISASPKMAHLDLSNCINIAPHAMCHWAGCVKDKDFYNLTSLSLSGCRLITEETFEYFANSLPSSLTSFNISGLLRLHTSLAIIGKRCPNLTSLDVSMIRMMDSKTLIAIAKGCRQLQTLELYSNKNIDDEGIISLATNCTSLTRLNLYGLQSVTDRSVVLLAKNLPNLTNIDCSVTGILDESLEALARNCPLTTLSLIGCKQITNRGLTSIITCCMLLQRLIINGCPLISDESLYKMAECSMFLMYLSMLDCDGISGTGILELGRGCKSLRVLRLSSGTAFTTAQIRQLHQLAPLLQLKL